MTVPGILVPMRTITIAVQLLIITALSIACSGSNGLYKKGQKLDEAGLHYEASNFYIDALQRKSSNSDAILALKVTGQKVLDDYYAVFYQYYSDKNLKKAVYAYLEADNFKSKVTSVGVKLTSADYYEDYYKEVKTLYIHELYENAQKEFLNGAKIAYETIITDFSDNDNKIIASKPLLSKEIFNQFNEALKERSDRGHYAEITFIGINSAIIKEHKKIDKILNVTVDFIAEVITCIKDKDKKVISGDPEKIKKIYDTWVFSRDITSANPNWQLVNTLT